MEGRDNWTGLWKQVLMAKYGVSRNGWVIQESNVLSFGLWQ